MQSKFFAHIGYDNDISSILWTDAIISLDTNTLLNAYKMTPIARRQFFHVLETFKNRLWMPYQVGKEFFSNRRMVIDAELKALQYTKQYFKKNIEALASSVEKSGIRFRTELATDLQIELNNLKEIIVRKFDLYPDKLERKEYYDGFNLKAEDPISKEIFEIFGDSIGDGFNPEDLIKIYEEGERRYNLCIPPGFEDADKKENYKKYGDLIIWKELIEHAKAESRPVIFITDDVKPDWWEINNEIRNPHPELLNEFYRITGQLIQIYTYSTFIEQASKQVFDLPDTSKAVEEINAINEEERDRVFEEIINGPKPGDIYYIKKSSLSDNVTPVLLYEEISNGIFYAFPITSKRDSVTINTYPTIHCGGKLAAVKTDQRIMVSTQNLRTYYDRIDLKELSNVIDDPRSILFREK
ncbi:L-rhamnose mutarotase [Paenibacillus phyllosphaerae]|uniref:L-rhamnose mutarotase n=1 Tax=Paenibacillus phyllosphaerae TaxID=274593 RepID=A0A7W5FQM7_9BACL|nr:L-rhamnose mutarotase [Paenibacillus phyllosphaerae]